jgi:uncharacterized protein
MPIVAPKPFTPPFYYFGNPHLQTIVPSLFRKIKDVSYQRERVETPDGDFLDLDWSFVNKNKKLVLVSHGLEGSADRHYVKGVIKVANQLGWDGLGWNCRSCSGELNRLPRFYHHGDTADLDFVVQHAIQKHQYEIVVLVGFSLGGSFTLKYFGEKGKDIAPQIKKGVAFSVPCDLAACSDELSKPNKLFYTRRFLKKLDKKIREKEKVMPNKISAKYLDNIKIFRQFDDIYSSQLHGFLDANDYYKRASSLFYLAPISRPVLLVNTLNDPFLTPSCYPTSLAEKHEFLHLEMPPQGGHVGFERAGTSETYSEMRVREWIRDL